MTRLEVVELLIEEVRRILIVLYADGFTASDWDVFDDAWQPSAQFAPVVESD